MGRSESDTDTGTPPAASTGLSPRDAGNLVQQSGEIAESGKVNRGLLGYLGLCGQEYTEIGIQGVRHWAFHPSCNLWRFEYENRFICKAGIGAGSMTHTPGPWELWTSCSWRRFKNSAGKAVCEPTIASDGHPDLFVSEEDARLIAAAPELLEALQGLLADITEYQTINHLGGHDNHWQVIARAAINKATGGAT